MVLARQRTRLKNRILATLAKYALSLEGCSDSLAPGVRGERNRRIGRLPVQSWWVTGTLLDQLDFLQPQIDQQERRLAERIRVSPDMQRLQSLPGIPARRDGGGLGDRRRGSLSQR